ncbi:MAG TPA: hypothetical protein VG476_04530 [Acidimicrobiales bacterium]|nr:hypothetical protein [Acidimicrobiales bacterium]
MTTGQPVRLRLSPEAFQEVDRLLARRPYDAQARRDFDRAMNRILTQQDYWQLQAATRNHRAIEVIVE